ncbi:MAG: 4Fe-4S dicluster domain-containing protein [candidate division KSB1 bacterium]|nr:4Fe-4S dicluster domain-containing protein [candidate division KSB1 bacterium]
MKRLFIDIPALLDGNGKADKIECEYLYHRKNNGSFSLLEVAEFASYCRQCKDAFCVAACPKDALERLESGTVKRYNMRCVGCKSCTLACPFGTIFPDVINYITMSCDYCLQQLRSNPDYEPRCVKTAPNQAFQMKETAENPAEHIFFVGDFLTVKSPSWLQKEERQ